jgi:L-lactate utilization protein LutB
MSKPLEQMSYAELQAELQDAIRADQAAEYQERLAAWQAAKDAARERRVAVEKEIDRRLELLDTREVQNGGQ